MKKYLLQLLHSHLQAAQAKTLSEQKAEMLRMVPIRRLTLVEMPARLLVPQLTLELQPKCSMASSEFMV